MTTPTYSSFPAHAIVTCPGGPRITTYIGRKDSTNPAPGGLLPDVHASGDSLFALFADKCFSAVDLAALLGAHSASKQFNVDISKAGQPQDSTPGLWDVKYYAEMLNPPQGVFVFPSDTNLVNQAQVDKEFKDFAGNQGEVNGEVCGCDDQDEFAECAGWELEARGLHEGAAGWHGEEGC